MFDIVAHTKTLANQSASSFLPSHHKRHITSSKESIESSLECAGEATLTEYTASACVICTMDGDGEWRASERSGWRKRGREMENPILASIVYAGCVRLAFA